jgi:hypothetical protein
MTEGVRCALCAKPLDPAEPNVTVPDLRLEMHDACYRQYLETGLRPEKPASGQ